MGKYEGTIKEIINIGTGIGTSITIKEAFKMSIKIIQACDDSESYKEMLSYTSEVNEIYANKFGHSYEKFIGTKKFNGWFNQIYLLKEEVVSASNDWLVWLDPDAFFWDHTDDIQNSVINSSNAIIGTTGSPVNDGVAGVALDKIQCQSDLNGGVLFFNIKHEKIGEIVDKWIELVEGASGEMHLTKTWAQGYLNEAIWILQLNGKGVIKAYDDDKYQFINYEGSLIRHVLDDTDTYHIEINRNNLRFTWTGYNWDQRLELVKQWTAEVKGE